MRTVRSSSPRPHSPRRELLAELDPELAAAARGDPVRVVRDRHACVSPEDVAHPLDGYGYVVPARGGLRRARVHVDVEQVGGPGARAGMRCSACISAVSAGATRRGSDDELVDLARDELALLGIEAEPLLDAHPPLAARDAAVRPRPPGAPRADRRRARATSWSRARRSGLPRRRHSRLHPLRRGGGPLGRDVARRRPRMTRETSERLFAEALELMPGGVSLAGARVPGRRRRRRSSSSAARARTSSTSTATATSTTSSPGGR